MDETSNQFECPICQQKFDQETIEKHVNKCLLISVDKPVTRHQENNKKQSTLFNKKNAKRGIKNGITSTNVINKKVKFNSDSRGKDTFNQGSSSSKMCDDEADASADDEVVVKKEKKDEEDGRNVLLSPKTDKLPSFFDKKTWKKRKSDEKKNSRNVKMKVTTSIDLTDSIETENVVEKDVDDDSIENVDLEDNIFSETSPSREDTSNKLDGNQETVHINIENNNIESVSNDISLENFRSPTLFNKASKETDDDDDDDDDDGYSKCPKKTVLQAESTDIICVELDFKTKKGKKEVNTVKPSLPLVGSSPEFSNKNKERVASDSNFEKDSLDLLSIDTSESESTPLKRVVDYKISKTECSSSPVRTTFQQELFNMSQGKDMIPSPPVNSNFRIKNRKGSEASDQEKRTKPIQPGASETCGTKTSFPSVIEIHGPITDTSNEDRGQNVGVAVADGKKGKEIILGKLPLSEQMRPRSLDDYVGQVATSTQKLLKELFHNDRIPSMILWGPPGCGKTSLAHIISHQCKSGQRYRFVSLSATMSGVNDVKEAVKIAKNEKRLRQKHTVLFIDEVHRFNKMQQDSFLPHIEDGTIVLIGATTENPSFHLNNALISRCRIVVLNQLDVDNIMKILRNAVLRLGGMEKSEDEEYSSDYRFLLEDGVVKLLADYSNGDARIALTSLDMLLQAKLPSNSTSKSVPIITCDQIKEELKRGHVNYDRKGDEHYDIISAFHKSIRGGDQDATMYWLARMLEGGEEPLYIARRMVRIASEDIGIADPAALNQAVSAFQACQFIGMPECDVILAQAATYLSIAPKSIAVYSAYKKAKTFIKECTGAQPSVPLHLRNAPTKLMKDLGYSKEYKYTPNFNNVDGKQDYLPKELVGTSFFT